MEAPKRKAEEVEEGVAKRTKVESSNGSGTSIAAAGPGATIAAPKKLGIDLDKLQKAKLALQKQKELQEKLKKAGITLGKPGAAPRPPAAAGAASAVAAAIAAGVPPAAAAAGIVPASLIAKGVTSVAAAAASIPAAAAGAPAAPAAPAAPKPVTKLPPPLILDEEGREIDPLTGKPVERRPEPQAPGLPSAAAQLQQEQQKAEEAAAKFFDPAIGNRGLRRLDRRPRTSFQFVEEGKLQKQAELGRLRAKFGDDAAKQLAERRRKEAEIAAAGEDANLIPLGTRAEAAPEAPPEEPLPEVEWWDARILADRGSYGNVIDGEPAQLKEEAITNLVQHPVLIEPPAEAPPPPPQPLKLTKRELKKLRTQRRIAREKEKQELIRQGLLEPPKPKVKISNLMRVLGAEATADPTAIEAEVRKQMAERAAAHEDRNLARMLTPAERREKKLKKLIGEEGAETHVALYKVGDLSNGQLRFKVDVNARENHMTGCSLVLADGGPGSFSLVIVEGSTKTLRRYEKLMLRRIDWQAGREEEEEEDAEGKPPKPPNYCKLVWQGVVKEPHFKKFKSETVHSEAAAKALLEKRGVGHYWDLAAAYVEE
ncbi:hypothetical protein ABPG77_006118 [Micractinium sp. CCAP 211/92]